MVGGAVGFGGKRCRKVLVTDRAQDEAVERSRGYAVIVAHCHENTAKPW
jgi:hypothetical protein